MGIKEIHNKNIMTQESYVDMKAAQQQKKPVEPKEEENPNLIAYLQSFVLEVYDAEYFIKEIHNKNIMTQESYVDMKAAQQQKKPGCRIFHQRNPQQKYYDPRIVCGHEGCPTTKEAC